MSFQSRLNEGLREPIDLATLLWPDTPARWTGTLLLAPIIGALTIAALWVAGVLELSLIGTITGTDPINTTKDWAIPAQGGLYLATSTATLVCAWLATVIAGAINAHKSDQWIDAQRAESTRH